MPAPVMNPAESHVLLVAAGLLALRRAKRYVSNDLPGDRFEYRASLNRSHDANAGAEVVRYAADDGRSVEGLTEQEAVALLYRDGRCPEWIDVSVEVASEGVTVFRLLCCGRYTDDA